MSNPAETMRDTFRDNVKEVRKAAQESAKAASKTSGDVQEDLEALRGDIANLVERLGTIVSARGSRAWKRTKSGVGEAAADTDSLVRKAGDDLTEVIEDSLQSRPYTTLAMAAGIGFLVGASWRR